MSSLTRRAVGRLAAALGVAPALPPIAASAPTGIAVGLQLYTVGEDLARDLAGTLGRIAAIGYREVETAGFAGKSVATMAAALRRSGLSCRSAHFEIAALRADLPARLAEAKTLGATHLVVPFPMLRPGRSGDVVREMALDDWRWLADELNRIGAAVARQGCALAYHNHNLEFRRFGEVVAYDELLRRTDPDLVKQEMDVGWVTAAGSDPLAYLAAHPGRFRLLHLKDVQPGGTPNADMQIRTTEVGSGVIDWKKLLVAAKAAGTELAYVEQEPPFARPRLEAAAMSWRYLDALSL